MDESEERGLSEKVKALVISGFLGAGKTTLLKNVLSWETGLSDTVVIVNEFGDVGIDGSLLKGARSGVVELAGGCICCTMQTDLKKTLNRVLDEFRPRRILIEATGVADPKAITETIRNAEFIERMEIERVVTVLESDFWDERDDMGSFYLNQLREADLILLNKIDRMEEEEIHRFLKEVHEVIPGSRILPTVHCHLDPESLWTQYDGNEKELKAGQFFPVRNSTPSDKNGDHQWHKDHESGECHQHDDGPEKLGYMAFSFEETGPLNEDCFRQFTEGLPWELFRMKGWVCFRDRTVMVNHVGGRSEWRDWDKVAETRLAFVGLRVDEKETIKKLRNCLAQS